MDAEPRRQERELGRARTRGPRLQPLPQPRDQHEVRGQRSRHGLKHASSPGGRRTSESSTLLVGCGTLRAPPPRGSDQACQNLREARPCCSFRTTCQTPPLDSPQMFGYFGATRIPFERRKRSPPRRLKLTAPRLPQFPHFTLLLIGREFAKNRLS